MPFPLDQPIESHMNLGFLGLLGGGMDYSIQGHPIQRYEDFKSVIYSQKDAESADMIRSAEETHASAFVLYVAGVAVGIDVALVYKPSTLLGVDWFDRAATGFVGAQIFWAVGALLDSNAEGRKYNAIQRYNHVLQGKKDQAWEWVPPLFACNGQGVQCLLGIRF
jgi:hypothetical protein